jgi:hypothetical protein
MNGSDVRPDLITESMAPFDRYLGEAPTELRQRSLDAAKYSWKKRLGLWSEPRSDQFGGTLRTPVRLSKTEKRSAFFMLVITHIFDRR